MEILTVEQLGQIREVFIGHNRECLWWLDLIYEKTIPFKVEYGFFLLMERRDSG